MGKVQKAALRETYKDISSQLVRGLRGAKRRSRENGWAWGFKPKEESFYK